MKSGMKLKKLLKDLPVEEVVGSKDLEICGIYNHSRLVAPKGLFIAKRGTVYDGNEYIFDAILAGAVAVVTDIKNPFLQNVTQIIVSDISLTEALLAQKFYGNPTDTLCLTGVTGTNGKTTTTHILQHILSPEICGFLGTVGVRIGEVSYKNAMTTPDCVTLHKYFREMTAANLTHCVLEVSSHAIDQKRIRNLSFAYGIYTNLSSEHLDYHGTMEEYAKTKRAFFAQVTKGIALNIDDSWAAYMRCAMQCPVYTYGMVPDAQFCAKNIETTIDQTHFALHHPKGVQPICLPLIGEANVYNALGAIVIAYAQGIEMETIAARLHTVPPVEGRLQRITHPKGCHVFVDYAHTEDALYRALSLLSTVGTGRIMTLFGCGGERDRQKRPKMARVAESFSDLVIVTHDNPRKEDPMSIITEICEGFLQTNHVVIEDRKEAIMKAIELAGADDIILIAGKGHETEQIFDTQSFLFSDAKVAEEICLM